MDFTQNIREWVTIDNRIKTHQDEIKRERILRNKLTTSILEHAENSNMQHAVIEITDGKLKFQNNRIVQPITFRFLEDCLNECISGDTEVKQIIKYIKSKREVKYVPDIKRSYNQTA